MATQTIRQETDEEAKARRNAEYDAKLEKSFRELEEGKFFIAILIFTAYTKMTNIVASIIYRMFSVRPLSAPSKKCRRSPEKFATDLEHATTPHYHRMPTKVYY
jgi:hypothetical protein